MFHRIYKIIYIVLICPFFIFLGLLIGLMGMCFTLSYWVSKEVSDILWIFPGVFCMFFSWHIIAKTLGVFGKVKK